MTPPSVADAKARLLDWATLHDAERAARKPDGASLVSAVFAGASVIGLLRSPKRGGSGGGFVRRTLFRVGLWCARRAVLAYVRSR